MPVPSDYSCAACGSTAFVRVPNASFEMWRGGGHSDSLDPVGELLVCSRCGKAELFVSDPAAFAAGQQAARDEAAEAAEMLARRGRGRGLRRRA